MPGLGSRLDSAALWFALVPLLVVLRQAGVYWLLARSWVERAPMPATLSSPYCTYRVVGFLLLSLGLVGVIAFRPDNLSLATAFVAAWAFGVVEYVNYFVVRLSYPTTRWLATVGKWRVSTLAKHMKAAA